MPKPGLQIKIILPVVLCALLAAAAVQHKIDLHLDVLRNQPQPIDYVLPGTVLRSLSMGQNGLLADFYWTRAVQYFGTQRVNRQEDFSLLSPLLNTAVELDPQLLVVYSVGNFFLSTPAPRGAGRPDQAVELLRRGIAANPDAWRLWHYLGFTYYWELGDFEQAAKSYLEGSKHPKAQPWMMTMAAAISAKGGNREISRYLWSEIHANTQDETIRVNAELQLKILQAADDVEGIERLAREFQQREKRWPNSLQELVLAGLLPAVPVDPTGVPYLLEPGGKVAIDPSSVVSRNNLPSPEALNPN